MLLSCEEFHVCSELCLFVCGGPSVGGLEGWLWVGAWL
jgi:hypothetical protein